jgi:hypothetical protein
MKIISQMKRSGASAVAVFALVLTSAVLLCGAGSAPVENFTPQGAMQADLNAGGHNVTNVATLSATNVVVSGTLSATTIAGLAPAATNSAAYQAPLTLTTTGTVGAATLSSGTLNIPQYGGGSAGVLSFNTRTGSITLTAADVNATGTINVTNLGYTAASGTATSALGVPLSGVAGINSGVATALGNTANGAGGVPVANSAGNLPNVTSRPVYIMANFQTGSNGNERGQIFMSFDALHWTQIRGLESYTPTLGGTRDLGLALVGSTWYVTYAAYTSTGTCTPYFGVASSGDLVHWSHVVDWTPVTSSGTNTNPIANPKIFTASTGTRYVSYYDQAAGRAYVVPDSSGTMSSFGTATDITPASGVSNAFDPWLRQDGSTYSMYLKPGGYSSTYHRFTATSFPTTTWTDTGTITAWGGSENVCVFTGPDGNYWAEMNNQGGTYQWVSSESPDQGATDWSTLTVVTQPSIVAQQVKGTYWDGGTIIPVTDSNTIINMLVACINQTVPNLGVTYQSEAFGALAPGAPQFNTPLSIQSTGTYITGNDQSCPLTVDDLKIGTSTGTSTGTFNYLSPAGTNLPLCLNSIVTINELTQYDTSDLFEVYGGKQEIFADGSQLQLRGRTTPNKYLNISYDTTNNCGYIDAEWSGVSSSCIALNATGQQPVLIGSETQTGSDALQVYNNGIGIKTAGYTLDLKGGANALSGTVTLSNGSGTITSTKLTGGMVVFLSLKTSSGTPSPYHPGTTVSSGTCVINGGSGDNSTYNWGAISVNN